MNILPLKIRELPASLSLKKLIGPSFIILGLGLGSGEIILWPYLASKYGMGIIWGAALGLTFQFFMNMEIERYALINGESIFVGFARKLKWLPVWFIISTFVPWIWPGIVASSATFFGHVIGVTNIKLLSIIFLLLIGIVLTLGSILYKTVETLQKILISIGVPCIFILSIFLANSSDWSALFTGIFGKGDGYWFLPAGISISSFLAALAYAGAGGNLNLAQSLYIKEKGYGMGKYAGRITSLIRGIKEDISINGSTFEINDENVKNFKVWWKKINIEHFVIFWITGAITICLLALLAFSTVYNKSQVGDINFVIMEASEIGKRLFPFAGTFFLLIAALTLFGTQLTVFDATSRILCENLVLSIKGFNENSISKVYYFVLWAQILAGICIYLMGITQPLVLLTIAAVLNAVAMFIHTGLTLWVNMSLLNKQLRPSFFRVTAMSLAFLFYGGFSIYTLVVYFLK